MNLSVLEGILKAYLKSLLSVPYIPEHFLSPDGYTSGHVAHIQLYTCHYLEPPPLERHFYSSSHLTKLPIQGVTWCTTFLGARPLYVASTGCHHAHLLCGLACRYHDLLHLHTMHVLGNCSLASTSG